MFIDSSASFIKKILTTAPPAFGDAEAVTIASDLYGIDGNVRSLVSERDQNFQIASIDARVMSLS